MSDNNIHDDIVTNLLNQLDDKFDYSGLPANLILTNVPNCVFMDPQKKLQFENLFCNAKPDSPPPLQKVKNLIYLPNFKRVRINFDSPKTATYYRIILSEIPFEGSTMKAFYIQDPIQLSSETHLKLPPPFRNFLISPPSSPPEGWEQTPESQPILNYDLISALAHLTPGESHELHPETEKSPKIVVHIAEEDENNLLSSGSSDFDEDQTDFSKTKVKTKKNSSGSILKSLPATSIHTPRPPLKGNH